MFVVLSDFVHFRWFGYFRDVLLRFQIEEGSTTVQSIKYLYIFIFILKPTVYWIYG